MIVLTHALTVSGVGPLSSPVTSEVNAKEGEHTRQSTPTIRRLSQISLLGLSLVLLLNVILHRATMPLLQKFDTANMRLPEGQFLPAGMYNDISAPARILMPAKQASPGSDPADVVCHVVSDGSLSPLRVDALPDTDVPLWAEETDNTHLRNLAHMLVCSPFTIYSLGMYSLCLFLLVWTWALYLSR